MINFFTNNVLFYDDSSQLFLLYTILLIGLSVIFIITLQYTRNDTSRFHDELINFIFQFKKNLEARDIKFNREMETLEKSIRNSISYVEKTYNMIYIH